MIGRYILDNDISIEFCVYNTSVEYKKYDWHLYVKITEQNEEFHMRVDFCSVYSKGGAFVTYHWEGALGEDIHITIGEM